MKRNIVMLTLFLLLIVLFTGCEEQPKTLKVLFANNGSNYSITGLCVKDSNENWSTSYIPEGKELYVNHYMEFTLPLKKGESVEYKVSVVKDETTVWLDTINEDPLVILRWSNPIRYAEISIKNSSSGNPEVTMVGGYDYVWDEADTFTKISW